MHPALPRSFAQLLSRCDNSSTTIHNVQQLTRSRGGPGVCAQAAGEGVGCPCNVCSRARALLTAPSVSSHSQPVAQPARIGGAVRGPQVPLRQVRESCPVYLAPGLQGSARAASRSDSRIKPHRHGSRCSSVDLAQWGCHSLPHTAQVACQVATGPRPQLTTFKNVKQGPVNVDLRDEGSESERRAYGRATTKLCSVLRRSTSRASLARSQARACSPAPTRSRAA
jgi:hypothetical protein